MVKGEDTAGACGKAFAVSDGVCMCLCVCRVVRPTNFSLSTHTHARVVDVDTQGQTNTHILTHGVCASKQPRPTTTHSSHDRC